MPFIEQEPRNWTGRHPSLITFTAAGIIRLEYSRTFTRAVYPSLTWIAVNPPFQFIPAMTAPSPSLLGVPPEILDEVIDAIDSPAALLSLSCSTKNLARLIIPNHLSFRLVRAPFSGENSIWEYFAYKAPQAAKVRILFVLQEGLPPLTPIIGYDVSRRIPSLPDSAIHHSFTRSDLESDLEQEKLIVSAVRNMKCLREFAWHREAPPSLRGRHGLWSTLKELGTVRRLDVIDCAERGDGILQSPSVRGPRLCVLANPG